LVRDSDLYLTPGTTRTLKAGPDGLQAIEVFSPVRVDLLKLAGIAVPDGVKAGVVFPDFSTNDFAGMALRCPPGGGAVVVSLDSKNDMKSGTKAHVTLVADAAQAAFDGRAEHSEMDDQTRVVVNLASTDAVLAALSKAGRIAYAINGVAVQLPTKNSRPVLAEFLSACGAQSATDPGAVDTSDQGQPSAAANGPTIDEPQLGFALRVPEGWDFNQSDEDGIKTWKLRNKQWEAEEFRRRECIHRSTRRLR